jgi:hypothetical protein
MNDSEVYCKLDEPIIQIIIFDFGQALVQLGING